MNTLSSICPCFFASFPSSKALACRPDLSLKIFIMLWYKGMTGTEVMGEDWSGPVDPCQEIGSSSTWWMYTFKNVGNLDQFQLISLNMHFPKCFLSLLACPTIHFLVALLHLTDLFCINKLSLTQHLTACSCMVCQNRVQFLASVSWGAQIILYGC